MDLFAFIIWYLHFYVSRVEQMSYQYTMRRELTVVNHMVSDEQCNSVFASNCNTVCFTMWYTSFKWHGQTVYITIWDTKDGSNTTSCKCAFYTWWNNKGMESVCVMTSEDIAVTRYPIWTVFKAHFRYNASVYNLTRPLSLRTLVIT